MTLAFGLLFIGLLLVLLEFYLPGAILGTLGAVALFASMIIFAQHTDSYVLIILYIFGCIAAIGLLIRFALWKIRHSGRHFNVYLDKDQEGYYASKYDQSAIGKTGTVFTDLRPGGYIIVEGKKHAAISKSGYIAKGAQVEVVGGEEESLIVQLKR